MIFLVISLMWVDHVKWEQLQDICIGGQWFTMGEQNMEQTNHVFAFLSVTLYTSTQHSTIYLSAYIVVLTDPEIWHGGFTLLYYNISRAENYVTMPPFVPNDKHLKIPVHRNFL